MAGKFEKLVVCALKKLQDLQGSSPKEITNYLSQEYDVPSKEIRKQVRLALRRGVSYGILQRNGGTYTCNKEFIKDPSIEVTEPCPWMKFGRKSKSKSRKSARRKSGRRKSKRSRSKKSKKRRKRGGRMKSRKGKKRTKSRKKDENCLVYLRVDKSKLARKKSKSKKRRGKASGCG